MEISSSIMRCWFDVTNSNLLGNSTEKLLHSINVDRTCATRKCFTAKEKTTSYRCALTQLEILQIDTFYRTNDSTYVSIDLSVENSKKNKTFVSNRCVFVFVQSFRVSFFGIKTRKSIEISCCNSRTIDLSKARDRTSLSELIFLNQIRLEKNIEHF